MRAVVRIDDPQVTPERSLLMSRVRGKDTKPEIIVRRLADSLAYRFRRHRRDLPGSPDLVFPKLAKSSIRAWLFLA